MDWEINEGGCDCGQIRYQVLNSPLIVHCCHCRWCQRETGSAFALNAMIESNEISLISGQPKLHKTPSASGQGQLIGRCPDCQVAVWSHYAGLGPKMAFLRVGTLDNPDLMPPDIHIYTTSKQPWVQLPAEIPAVPEYYRARDYWPAESLKRRQAMQ